MPESARVTFTNGGRLLGVPSQAVHGLARRTGPVETQLTPRWQAAMKPKSHDSLSTTLSKVLLAAAFMAMAIVIADATTPPLASDQPTSPVATQLR
jgi:type VI protein secretion system component VasF